jgi:hypothetical protein
MIEWDNDIPPYPILVGEVKRANAKAAKAIKSYPRATQHVCDICARDART